MINFSKGTKLWHGGIAESFYDLKNITVPIFSPPHQQYSFSILQFLCYSSR